MKITDLVRVKADGRVLQIAGFYRLDLMQPNNARLAPCLPLHPLAIAISTDSEREEFHCPFDVEFAGASPWPASAIEEARRRFQLTTIFERLSSITMTNYPDLLRKFMSLTNHERLLIEQWREAQAQICNL